MLQQNFNTNQYQHHAARYLSLCAQGAAKHVAQFYAQNTEEKCDKTYEAGGGNDMHI
jgi:hypothetical protein